LYRLHGLKNSNGSEVVLRRSIEGFTKLHFTGLRETAAKLRILKDNGVYALFKAVLGIIEVATEPMIFIYQIVNNK